jgi:hypothetical protein
MVLLGSSESCHGLGLPLTLERKYGATIRPATAAGAKRLLANIKSAVSRRGTGRRQITAGRIDTPP